MSPDDSALAGAIRRQEERLAREPTSLAFAQLADLYRKAGRTRDAIGLCREGLQRHPRYATARLILAKALLEAGDIDGALTELATILQATPKDVQCHRLAAEAHRRRGDVDAALRHLERVVTLDPGDRESRALLPLLRAEVPDGSGLGRVLADDTFATLAFGSLCLEQGLIDESVMVFTRILRRDPGNPEARERLEAALHARSRRKG
jgi:tetratricopeptide (TPR) repeat protein